MLKRGMVVRRPDKWEQRGKYKHGKAIVMAVTKKSVRLCTFNPGHPIGPSNPLVAFYNPKGFVPIGKVKRIPKACREIWADKKHFYAEHPYFKNNPHKLAGASTKRRR